MQICDPSASTARSGGITDMRHIPAFLHLLDSPLVFSRDSWGGEVGARYRHVLCGASEEKPDPELSEPAVLGGGYGTWESLFWHFMLWQVC